MGGNAPWCFMGRMQLDHSPEEHALSIERVSAFPCVVPRHVDLRLRSYHMLHASHAGAASAALQAGSTTRRAGREVAMQAGSVLVDQKMQTTALAQDWKISSAFVAPIAVSSRMCQKTRAEANDIARAQVGGQSAKFSWFARSATATSRPISHCSHRTLELDSREHSPT